MKTYNELQTEKRQSEFGMIKTFSGYWKYHSLLHGKNLYFDDLESCIASVKYTEKIEKYFEKPTKKNRQKRIDFCNKENLLINID